MKGNVFAQSNKNGMGKFVELTADLIRIDDDSCIQTAFPVLAC